MTQLKTRKKDVIRSLLQSMKQSVEKKAESNGTRPAKKQRDLPSLELGVPVTGTLPTPR